jgi:hypothetical protein
VTQLCAVSTCRPIQGQHLPTCADVDCEGCLPHLAADGSAVCGWHIDTIRTRLRELPALWEAIAEPSTGARGGSADEDDDGPTLGAPIEARHLIRSQLVSWLKVLEEAGRMRLPVETEIVAGTRALIVGLDTEATVTRIAARLAEIAGERDDWRRWLDASHRAAGRAAAERRMRETGRDILEVLAERLDRHLLWLLATEHAQIFAEDILDLWARARPIAYRGGRAPITIACACGSRVALDPDASVIRCASCGEWGDLAWWRAAVVPVDGPLSLRDLADWMLLQDGPSPTWEQLRNWTRADRGPRLVPVVEAGRDEATGRLRPALYDREAAIVVADARMRMRI